MFKLPCANISKIAGKRLESWLLGLGNENLGTIREPRNLGTRPFA